jgi:broad specificity phosphatase PhoE
MKEIYVFRHGETDWNKAGRMQGHADIPLNETGREQALVLQDYFAKHPIEVILCSDLGRAQETARIARGSLQIPIVIDPRQRETKLGDAEGLTREQIATQMHPDIWHKWHTFPEHWDHRFPNGESKKEHLERIRGGLLDFLAKTSYTKIGLSSHGGSMRRLLHSLRPDVTEPIVVGNCYLYKLDYDPARGPGQELWVEDVNPLLHQQK